MTARDSVRNDRVIIILPTCSGLSATRICLLAVTISMAQPATLKFHMVHIAIIAIDSAGSTATTNNVVTNTHFKSCKYFPNTPPFE
jgi:hypothetical protein